MIDYQGGLIEGCLLTRYKRFFADIEIESGVITAHCANTGRMTGLLSEGARVWVREQPPGRKLAYAWELIEVDTGMACVNTARANQLVANADLSVWMSDVKLIRREPKVGSHRFDLELSRNRQAVYVELKSVTLCGDGGQGLFPDAPSERATQHLNLLTEMAEAGIETHLAFVAMHSGIRSVTPHQLLDPDFANACRQAVKSGVRMHALKTEITPQAIRLTGVMPVSVD